MVGEIEKMVRGVYDTEDKLYDTPVEPTLEGTLEEFFVFGEEMDEGVDVTIAAKVQAKKLFNLEPNIYR